MLVEVPIGNAIDGSDDGRIGPRSGRNVSTTPGTECALSAMIT